MRSDLLPVLLGAAMLAACTVTPPDPPAATPRTPAPEEAAAARESEPVGPRLSPGSPRPTSIVAGSDACSSDADCMPASCCHATTCAARSNAPVCADIFCTQSCQGGSIDCGGSCLCQDGRCAARIVSVR